LIDVGGTLYGTTYGGGASSQGTVFSVTPAGADTVVHSFSGSDGAGPEAGLVNIGGRLYGTTFQGGANGMGTVFAMTPAGVETVLHSFQGGSDGANPFTGLLDVHGTLYGTTTVGGGTTNICSEGPGCGTAFKVTKKGGYKLVHSFDSSDGQYPFSGLTEVDGKLYGTTFEGGASGAGAVFALTP
jgi:uncharacterized repeat protein (TIGR03803 family)